MKITPITDKPKRLIPTAIVLTGCAAVASCQQQQFQAPPGAPLPPPMEEKKSPATHPQQVPGVILATPEEEPQQLGGEPTEQ